MKSNSFLLFLLVASLTSTCHGEGSDCHHGIVFKNNSKDTLIYALRGSDGSGRCALIKCSDAAPNEQVILDLPRYCWEQELAKGKVAEMYVIDPSKFNKGAGLYNCDSIGAKNNILKHYKLTLNDLKGNNFIINYK